MRTNWSAWDCNICDFLRRENRGVGEKKGIKVLWCKWFHREDHVCWDNLWKKDNVKPIRKGAVEKAIPGKCVWFCNKCKRSWTTVNPVVFETDCADDRGVLPKKYYRQPGLQVLIRKCKCDSTKLGEKKNA
jgi:hypothetical protein